MYKLPERNRYTDLSPKEQTTGPPSPHTQTQSPPREEIAPDKRRGTEGAVTDTGTETQPFCLLKRRHAKVWTGKEAIRRIR